MSDRICPKCATPKPAGAFYDGGGRCKACRSADAAARWAAVKDDPEVVRRNRAGAAAHWWKNRERHLAGKRLRGHGITEAAMGGLRAAQGGRCAICGLPEETVRVNGAGRRQSLSVDHDHACCPGDSSCGRCIRGLLCFRCNTAIGLLGDRPEIALAAATYLDASRRLGVA